VKGYSATIGLDILPPGITRTDCSVWGSLYGDGEQSVKKRLIKTVTDTHAGLYHSRASCRGGGMVRFLWRDILGPIYHRVLLGFDHIVLLRAYHRVLLGFDHIVLLRAYHRVLLGFDHIVLLRAYHRVLLGFDHIVLLRIYHRVLLSFDHAVLLRAYHDVLFAIATMFTVGWILTSVLWSVTTWVAVAPVKAAWKRRG
jgi:hypothetical protein